MLLFESNFNLLWLSAALPLILIFEMRLDFFLAKDDLDFFLEFSWAKEILGVALARAVVLPHAKDIVKGIAKHTTIFFIVALTSFLFMLSPLLFIVRTFFSKEEMGDETHLFCFVSSTVLLMLIQESNVVGI